MNSSHWSFRATAARTLVLSWVLCVPLAANAADIGKTFATPEEAFTALIEAAKAEDIQALGALVGPSAADIENPDRVQASNDIKAFAAAASQTNQIVRESENKCVLEVGTDLWPFAIPLAKKDGQWYFDVEAGKEELLNRRIGKNELATLQAVRAYVEAQRDYASKDRDGDEVLEYAQKILSTPGTKDGLYWPPELDGELSPLGPLVAQSQNLGYSRDLSNKDAAPEPFHGYFFKILVRQAKSAPGGKYDYIINGKMIGGFALVAWPAEYGESGIMTFIVNQQGRVYQKDLGPNSEKVVRGMTTYDPDKTWSLSPD